MSTPTLSSRFGMKAKSGSPKEGAQSRARRRRPVAAFAAAVAVALTAACSAGTAGNTTSTDPTASGGGSGAPVSSKYLNYSPCCSWNTTWSFNPYNVNGLGIQTDFVVLRLAIQKAPSMTEFVPQLAEKWEEQDGKLVVHLNKAAKWQDDKPVTSKDVITTAYLNATRGDGFWNDITEVKAVDDHTVEFILKKGQSMELAKADILPNITVYPSQVYGELYTPELKKDVETYYAAFHKDPVKAGSMEEFKRIGAVFQKLAALKVDKLIGNGPFKLDNITTKEAKLTKWDGFFGADKVKVPGIRYLNGSNQTIYPQLFSNGADFTNVYLPPPILKRWQGTKGSNLALPQAFGFVMGFNSSKYPLSIKEVRQALAYVIPRQKMAEAAYGAVDGAGGVYKEVPTGISPSMEKLYLTEEQLGKLNKYEPDSNKAAELLKKAGFTQKDGQWYDPKGKQFTLTLTVNADTSDIVTSFNAAATALTAFGIKSEVHATSGAQQDADQHNGDFEVGMYFIGGNNPLQQLHGMLGPGQNFTKQGNYAGKRGIGFGPEIEVPGQGKVDVATTINQQLRVTPPDDTMKARTWEWVQVVNEQVPYIWYATKVYQFSFSTQNYDNWPKIEENGTSELWDIIGSNMNGGISLAIQEGYIVPK